MKKIIFILALLLLPVVYAQLPWTITDLRCGNDKLDDFEMCENGIESPNYCEDVAELLEIDTACDTFHCTCLPRVNKAYCGNDRREGVEICDGSGEDFCPELGQRMNLSLICNPLTCGCELNETVPADYNPLVVEELENASQTASVCGNKKVERAEDCDPPNTLCTTDLGEPGICTEECRCVEPGALDEPEDSELNEQAADEVNETSNETSYDAEVNLSNVNDTLEVNDSINESNLTGPADEEAAEEKGFFGKLWAFIVSIFS